MRNKKINVLSLFDGISCGQLALERAGFKVNNYFASEIDKHAICVTQENFPNTIQIGDVTKVNGTDLPKIDLLMGGSPCFVGDTMVICKDVVKPIKDVKINDYVLTHHGRYQKVLNIGGGTKGIFELKSQGNTPTLTTSNHPYYVRDRKRVYNKKKRTNEWIFNEPKWLEVEDIKKGYYVGTPILKTSENPLNLTENECYLLGIYIGDGHTRKNHRISDKRIVEIAEKYCGIGHENKLFSKMLLDLPINLLKRVIDGYEFGDGSYRRNTYRATTISKKLVESLSLAIAKVYRTTCSIEFTKRPKKTIIQGREVNQMDTWVISYRKKHPKKSRAWVIDNVVWNPVKYVVDTGDIKETFNLEVEEDNSYIANNHIVHNCQGFSFSGKQLNFNDPRSKLFFEFVRLVKEVNPKYFLLENVVMKQEYQDVISQHLGVEPVKLNSTLTSAQNRVRLYWANFEITEPIDHGIKLIDILEDDEMVGPSAIRGRYLNKATILGRRLDERGKRQDYNKKIPITQCLEVRESNRDKSNCLTTVGKDTVLTTMPIGRHPDAFNKKLPFRHYTKVERCRLMNLPDNYCDSISANQTLKATGNGWEVGMITHIFRQMDI